ncbi:MAG: pyruvate formate lyase family protein, partial [Gemmatimonadota bacterium]
YLWPYLEADLAAARTTLEEARELVTELFVKLHERIAPHDGWVEAVPVGGRRPDGASAINPLSYMIVEVITELEQTHPSVYVRLPDDAPEDFVDLTARYLVAGRNRAQVYGDDAVIEALHTDGVALEDARHWTAGGCMEVSPQGCNCDLLFSFAHNVARTLEVVLNGGCLLATGERASPHTGSLADYASFEELYEAFATELERELHVLLRRLDIWLECYAEFRPSFLLSSMTHDCLERGRSLNDGGARYTDYGGSGVGIPNVGDSLYAIRRAVFDERRFSGAEVLEAMRADFTGHEAVHAYLRSVPKFGSDCEEVDALVDRVLLTFSDVLHHHRTPHGGRVRPIILGFSWVVTHGQQVGATADGRRAGRPLAHGLSPQSGSATRGLSAAINSATRLTLERVSGGGAMMWDLDPAWATPEVVKAMLKTFVAQGGAHLPGERDLRGPAQGGPGRPGGAPRPAGAGRRVLGALHRPAARHPGRDHRAAPVPELSAALRRSGQCRPSGPHGAGQTGETPGQAVLGCPTHPGAVAGTGPPGSAGPATAPPALLPPSDMVSPFGRAATCQHPRRVAGDHHLRGHILDDDGAHPHQTGAAHAQALPHGAGLPQVGAGFHVHVAGQGDAAAEGHPVLEVAVVVDDTAGQAEDPPAEDRVRAHEAPGVEDAARTQAGRGGDEGGGGHQPGEAIFGHRHRPGAVLRRHQGARVRGQGLGAGQHRQAVQLAAARPAR